MKYILDGNEKDVANVIREQRIRVGRGLISFSPISECGLITEDDARKAMDEKFAELTTSVEEKDELIASLTTERDSLAARVAELEMPTADNKELPADDLKELPTEDSKDSEAPDDNTVNAEEKKRGRPSTRKTE